MILADTSIWIDNFRRPNPRLLELARGRQLVTHPLVIGELAMGALPSRTETLGSLHKLNRTRIATHREVLAFVEAARLWGSGLGYVDACLLAAVRLADDCLLWTKDRRLREVAEGLDLDFRP